MLPYSVLAGFYDAIIKDEYYDKFTNYIVALVKENCSGQTGVDVACGSGIVTLKLKKAGYNVTGVDISEEMLQQAQASARNENLYLPFLRQDMKSLKLFEKVSFITVINDGLNYIKQADLVKTFKAFYKNLKNDGVLIFDISSSYKLKNVLGNNMYGDDNENLSYIWFNTFSEDKVDLNITFFKKQGESYIRYEENQTQYVHELDCVTNALNTAGFEIVSVTGEFGEQLTSETERIIFIAKPKNVK